MKTLLISAIASSIIAASVHAEAVDGKFVGQTETPRVANPLAPKTEIATYMGVATSILPNVLRDHLGLAKGVGLKIDAVEPGSPAEAAGIKPNDVLLKLDDQQIINSHQLTVLVRNKQPGEKVTLNMISQGKNIDVSMTLGQKELPIVEYPFSVIPDEKNPNPVPRSGLGRASSQINHVDNEHVITISCHDDQKEIVIKDRKDNLIYSGPLNTAEDYQKVPAELQKKVELILKAAGNLKFYRENPSENINRGNVGAM